MRSEMKYKIKLQIGEFSKLCGVTVKTLRFYEKKGLLYPAETDENTGYRYYYVSQFQQMQTICGLKESGFSLDEIFEIMKNESCVPTMELLEKKLEQTEALLHKIVSCRDRLQSMLDSQKKIQKMEKITIQKLPAIIVASHRTIIRTPSSLGEKCVNVIGPEMARLGCKCPLPGYCFTVVHDDEYKSTDIDIEYCEEVEEMGEDSDIITFKKLPEVPTAVCMKCYGSYEKMPQNYMDMYAYIEKKNYKIVGELRASYVDGIWNEADPEKWLTIIQVPVEKIN